MVNVKKMTDWLKTRKGETVWGYMQIVAGCLIGGAAYPLFLVPNDIAPGGVSGLAMILNYLFTLPIGVMSMIMNVPLFFLGYKSMGKRFAFRSLVAMVLFSVSIDLLKLEAMTMDPLLGSLYGGIVLGTGVGLIMRGGATTGGSDMLARIIHRAIPFIGVGMILFLIDFVVVVLAGVFMGASQALYALICIFVSGKVVDMVVTGFSGNKACFIMSNAWEKVSGRIMTDMERGVTQLTARGAYTGQERPVVLCVASPQEVAQIKAIVREEDETAFMFITEAHEALGEGFSSLTGEK